MLLNCGIGEDSWESLGLQGDPTSPSILKEYSLEGLMLKLKPQYFGHLMGRTDSLQKTLMLGKIEGRRRRGRQRISGWMASLARWTRVWASSGNWWWTGKPGLLKFMGSQRVGHDWAIELNWTETRFSSHKVYQEGQTEGMTRSSVLVAFSFSPLLSKVSCSKMRSGHSKFHALPHHNKLKGMGKEQGSRTKADDEWLAPVPPPSRSHSSAPAVGSRESRALETFLLKSWVLCFEGGKWFQKKPPLWQKSKKK